MTFIFAIKDRKGLPENEKGHTKEFFHRPLVANTAGPINLGVYLDLTSYSW